MKNSTIITEIDGQGQKIAAVVLEFGESIKPVDMQPDNYAVENQTVKEPVSYTHLQALIWG